MFFDKLTIDQNVININNTKNVEEIIKSNFDIKL